MQTFSYLLANSQNKPAYDARRRGILTTARQIDPSAWDAPTSLIELHSSIPLAKNHGRIWSAAKLQPGDFLYGKDDRNRQICIVGPYDDRFGIQIQALLDDYIIVESISPVMEALMKLLPPPTPTTPISPPLLPSPLPASGLVNGLRPRDIEANMFIDALMRSLKK